MYPAVISVKPLANYKLELKFDDSLTKIFDVTPFLKIGKFEELKDVSKFSQVFVSFDTIEWKNGLDLDPELLYEKSVLADN
jgi:hypothetical protein